MTSRLDFNDLLKWSLTHQDQYPHEIGPISESQPLSSDDHKFLLDAMDNKVMDEQKRIKVLLQVLRLPQDPKTLYQLQNIDTNHHFKVLQDKESLRTLLEMRQEDDQRKQLGLDIIGAEYIPGNVLVVEEVMKKNLILTKLRQTMADTSVTSSMHDISTDNDNDNNDNQQRAEKEGKTELSQQQEANEAEEDPIAKDRRIKHQRLAHITKLVEAELPIHIKEAFASLPIPTDNELRTLYHKIRNEKLDCFDEIEDRTYRGDNAVGFVIFNGIPILKQYLLSNDYEIASTAWRLLGNIVSNQPLSQQKAIEYNLIPIAIEALNITRYIPSILAAYYYASLPSQQPSPTASQNPTNHHTKNSPSPLQKHCPLQITQTQFDTLMAQYDLTVDDLYQYSHFGTTYIASILPLLKSVLFFLISVCNNNSTAQTQFIQHHGFVPLSHLFELGQFFIQQQPNNTTQTQTNTHYKSFIPSSTHSVASNVLIALISPYESVFKQTLRRVVQFCLLLLDDEYKVTTSSEICHILFQQVQTYQFFSTQLAYPLGEAIYHFVPQTLQSQENISQQAQLLFMNTNNNKHISNGPGDGNNNTHDEGHIRSHFQEPIAPLRFDDASEIHPAFKLKHNLSGGKLNKDGEHIETQYYLAPFIALFIPFFFPYTLWQSYITCNDFDRDLVLSIERLLGLMFKNSYKLVHFDANLQHFKVTKNITAVTNITKPTPDDIEKWFEIEFNHQKEHNGKFSTVLHDILTTQVQAVLTPSSEETKGNDNNSNVIVTKSHAINIIIGIFDQHVKTLVAKANGGPKPQQQLQREWNRAEIQFINIIKSGLNQ